MPDRPKKPRTPGKARPRTTHTPEPKKKTEPREKNAGDTPQDSISNNGNGESKDEAKERYLRLLMGLAEKQESPDPAILDRIERVLLPHIHSTVVHDPKFPNEGVTS